MSNQIIKILNDANQFRESVKTKEISSPNNEEYMKWNTEFTKKINSKGGYIPPNKDVFKDFSEEIICRAD